MPALSRAKKSVLIAFAIFGVLYIALLVAGPVLEYLYGPSRETMLFHQLSALTPALVLVFTVGIYVLRAIGVLPAVQRGALNSSKESGLGNRSRNLVIWIAVAIGLVFVFNFLQGPNTAQNHVAAVQSIQQSTLTTLLINIAPVILLILVWVYFLYRQSAKKKKDLGAGG